MAKRVYSKEGEKKAQQAVDFIRGLQHTKGEWAGKNFTLLPWQENEIIRPLFGTLTDGGIRQYRRVYVTVPKKNGKSELAAAIGLKLLVADGEPGAEIYSAASDRFQASLVSGVAVNMVKQNPTLFSRCDLIESQKRIVYPTTNSIYVTLSADAYTKHGINVHGLIFDELHAQKTRELYDTLTFGAGSARRQPVQFIITTAGFDRDSIGWEVHDYALRVLKGRDPETWGWVQGHPIDDPTFLPVVYSLREEEDWRDKNNWIKVNPSFGHIFQLETFADEFRGADESVSLENNFRRFRLNQWVKQSTRWIKMSVWDNCFLGAIRARHLRGRPCFTALDMSSNTDLTAMISVFPPINDDFPFEVVCRFFIPEENVIERVKRDHVPYDQWIKDGFITTTPGNVVDYRYIVHELLEWSRIVNLVEVPYDRWGAALVQQDLTENGITMVPFGQGFASMSQPTKDLEQLILSRKLNHANNPVLRWMADNCVVKTDAAGGIKIDKAKSTDRVDGMVALVMALDRAIKNGNNLPKSIYDERGIITLEA